MHTPHRFALAGTVLDLWRVARFSPSNPHSYSKFLQINALRRKTDARVFIEAGTYLGVTAGRCARVFERVYTVEIDPQLARQSRDFLKGRPNVETFEGDAMKVMPDLLRKPDLQSALIFLDGHVAGGYEQSGDEEFQGAVEPALEGLELLTEFRDKINGIVVDDFRLFGTEGGFPAKSELLARAEAFARDDFEISVHFDQLLLARRKAR